MSIESNPVQAPKGGAGAVKIAAAVLLSGCLIASLGLNIYQAAVQNQKVSEYIDHELERQAEEAKKENEYMEDGYRVGGEYEIRSTTHISDAYLSGDSSLLSPEDEETLSMAEAVLSEVIEEGMSRYEQEEAVYLWLVSNIGRNSSGVISRPGMSRSAFTPHDVLASRSAVCVGYATTFRLFMNMLGMDCRIVHNEYHSWNLVRLDDGWYHVDIYSDTHGVPYGNFNMTDLVAKTGHSWDESALPEAKSVTYTPAVQNSIQVDGVLDVPAALKEALDGRSRALFFQFKQPLTDEDMDMAEFLAVALERVLSGMLEDSYYFRAAWYPGEGDSYILGLLLESHRIEEEESNGIDAGSPEGQEIIRAIAAAFDVDPVALGGHPTQSESPADVPGAVFTRSGRRRHPLTAAWEVRSMDYIKKVLCLALAAALLLSAPGCGGREDDGPDLDPAEMARAMMDADTTLPKMVERSSGDDGGEDSFTYLSSLDYSKVDAYFYACADAGTAEEIAVVKLKDKGDAAALMESLHDHIKSRQGTFAEYDPEQLPLTESAVVTREGRYVTLIVSKKSGLVQQEFQKFFQQDE